MVDFDWVGVFNWRHSLTNLYAAFSWGMLVFLFFQQVFFILHSWRSRWSFLTSFIAPFSVQKAILLSRLLRLQLSLPPWRCRLAVNLISRRFKFLSVYFLLWRELLLLGHSINRHEDRLNDKYSLLEHRNPVFFFFSSQSLKLRCRYHFCRNVRLAWVLELPQQVFDWPGHFILFFAFFAKHACLVDSLMLVYVDVWALLGLDWA